MVGVAASPYLDTATSYVAHLHADRKWSIWSVMVTQLVWLVSGNNDVQSSASLHPPSNTHYSACLPTVPILEGFLSELVVLLLKNMTI